MEKKFRIRKNMEFKNIYKTGKNYWNRNLVLYVKKNGLTETRVGYTITKKIGNAVVRNKIRRRMKEIVRLNFHNIKEGYDLVFIAKRSILNIPYQELEGSMIHIMSISKLLKKR
nr:ribonuclease P protein component [Tissierella sp.]